MHKGLALNYAWVTGACACRLLGKAFFQLHDISQAEAAYRRAAAVDGQALLAWKGLAELHAAHAPDGPGFIEAHEHLVQPLLAALFFCDLHELPTMLLAKSY